MLQPEVISNAPPALEQQVDLFFLSEIIYCLRKVF